VGHHLAQPTRNRREPLAQCRVALERTRRPHLLRLLRRVKQHDLLVALLQRGT
tara:strand:+ start:896 stop:1054 length:159 start_codon:yes stop_codon:yes gene_type:complete